MKSLRELIAGKKIEKDLGNLSHLKLLGTLIEVEQMRRSMAESKYPLKLELIECENHRYKLVTRFQ